MRTSSYLHIAIRKVEIIATKKEKKRKTNMETRIVASLHLQIFY